MHNTEKLDHAIVVGGSMAGLLAACALSSHAGRVIVIERDVATDTSDVRKGVPQGHQPHVLLDGGRKAMDRLVPGLFADLLDDGSVEIDFGRQVLWYHAGGWKANCPSPYRLFMQTRPFLESHVRRRLCSRQNVEFLGRSEVVRPLIRKGRVHGVEVRSLDDASTSELSCDLFVDATGRGSRSPRWLEGEGYEGPVEQSVRIDLCYAARLYERPEGHDSDWKALAIYGRRPRQRRHGVMFTVEENRWLITMMGYEGDHPPQDPVGLESFARSLDRPELYDMMRAAKPLGDVARYKIPSQKWRRYDRLVRLPEGYAVVGDAVCSFDPVFAQGMTIAALEAELLGDLLRAGRFDALAFAKATGRIINIPWFMSSIEAHRYPTAEATRPKGASILHSVMDRIFDCANYDPVIYLALISVMHLDRDPRAFLRPSVLARLAWGPRSVP